MISFDKGLGNISFPGEWLNGFNMSRSFSSKGSEGLIYFRGIGRAFRVWTESNYGSVTQSFIEISEEEIKKINWGKFCSPWEPYGITKMFGRNNEIMKLI